MKNIKKEISKEKYNEFIAMSEKEYRETVRNSMPMEIICGYGYYGCSSPYEENGKFFYNYSIGSSCD